MKSGRQKICQSLLSTIIGRQKGVLTLREEKRSWEIIYGRQKTVPRSFLFLPLTLPSTPSVSSAPVGMTTMVQGKHCCGCLSSGH